MFNLRFNTDAALVQRVLTGERDAYGLLVERHLRAAHAVALARTGNYADAEDIAQDAFIKAYESLDTLREPHKFAAWLLTIVRNAAFRVTTQRRREAPLSTELESRLIVEAPDSSRAEVRHIVHREVLALEEGLRDALLLHYFAGKSAREVATLLGITREAAKKRLQRGREALSVRLLKDLGLGDKTPAKQKAARITHAALAVPAAWQAAGAAHAAAGAGMAAAASAVSGIKLGAMAIAVVAAVGLATFALRTPPPPPTAPPAAELPSPADAEPFPSETLATAPEPAPTATAVAAATASPGVPVTGKVVGTDGTPIEGARVRAAEWVRGGGGFDESATTDEDGTFTIHAPHPAEILLLGASKPDWVGFRQSRHTLTRAGLANVELTLYRSGSIAGRVLDDRRRPVAGTKLTVRYHHPDNAYWTHEVETDVQGQFEAIDLLPGTHSLAVVPESAFRADLEDLRVELVEGEAVTGVEVVYPGAGRVVAGRVTDPDGQPIEDVFVQCVGGTHPPSTRTDADGRFHLARVPEPFHMTMVVHQDYNQQSVASGDSHDRMEIVLTPKAGVSGRVVDATTGLPVPEFTIGVHGGRTSAYTWREQMAMKPVSDPDGRFTVDKVPAEAATIIVRAKGYANHYEPIQAAPGQAVADVTIRLGKSAEVEGIVVSGSGEPVPHAAVFLGGAPPLASWRTSFHEVDQMKAELDEAAYTRANEDGRFTLDGLSAGTYRVSAVDVSLGQGENTVTIGSRDPAPLRIVLSNGGTVAGLVTSGGEPLADAPVSVGLPGGIGEIFGRTTTGADGRFEIADIPARDVGVFADYPGIPVFINGRRLVQNVTVREGATTEVRIDFPEAVGVVEGVITVHGEVPSAASIEVRIAAASGTESRRIPVESGGAYRIESLPVGTVALHVSAGDPRQGMTVAAREVQIASADPIRLDIDLAGTASVEGAVQGLSGTENGSVHILAGTVDIPEFDMVTLTQIQPVARGHCMVQPDGAYRLENLDAGTYTLLAMAVPSQSGPAMENARWAVQRIDLKDGESATVNFDFR